MTSLASSSLETQSAGWWGWVCNSLSMSTHSTSGSELTHSSNQSAFDVLWTHRKYNYESTMSTLTRWLWRTRYLVLRQYCLVTTYELTHTSHDCGQQ